MSQEPFGDIPLFREIQRLLSSSEGPINLEIARQVGTAVGSQAGEEPPRDQVAERSFAAVVARSEQLLAGYTLLPVEEPARTGALTRTQWIASTLDGWLWLLEHLSARLSAELAKLGPEAEAGNPLSAAMGQIGPLLLGIQAGTLVGHLSLEALGRYDLPIPRADDGRLFFLPANLDSLARQNGLEAEDLRLWLALRDVSRRLPLNSAPWPERYLKSQLTELVDSVELDMASIERRLMDLQSNGMDMLEAGMGAEDTLPIVPTERHRRALDRLRAFVALLDGYSRHATSAVSGEILTAPDRLADVMRQRAGAPSPGERMLAQILGLDLDRTLEASGATFAAVVVKLKGLPALNRVWEAPDNLPSIDEIRDPFAWMERVLGA
ncbi:zinc-dependent metalloprotease [soil metagenome]